MRLDARHVNAGAGLALILLVAVLLIAAVRDERASSSLHGGPDAKITAEP